MKISFNKTPKGEINNNVAFADILVKRSNLLAVILLSGFVISLAILLYSSDYNIYKHVLIFLGIIEVLVLASLYVSNSGYLFVGGLVLNCSSCALFFGLSIVYFGREAGFQNYFLLLSLIPLISFNRQHRSQALTLFALNIIFFLFVLFFPNLIIEYIAFPDGYSTTLSFVFIILVYIVMLSLVIIHIRITSNKEKTLRREAMEARLVNERLKEINDSKDRFFSIISHDLRGPLGTVSAFLDYFTDESDNFSREEIKESVVSMNKYTHEVYALLENLLTWSRIQSGSIKVNRQQDNMSERIRANLELYSAQATQKDIKILYENTDDIVFDFDLDMINTILRNLISNAIKFTPRGGTILINTIKRPDDVEVSVLDSGKGMTDSVLKNLFRIDKKQNSCFGTEGEKGSGLGLILCKHFIECHNGILSISNNKGKGCRVTFRIPVK